MRALILMHIASEGPGTLGKYLEEEGFHLATVHLYRGDPLPLHPEEADLIVSMGGPMNVYDDAKHPFLTEEGRFLARAIDRGVPLLGICLGAQLIARAAGARVYKAPVAETGWDYVSLTEEGREDPLFNALPHRFPVLQWHEDTFDIPDGGTWLASSKACPHQAFRIGRAWGLQFHVEADATMLSDWFAGRDDILKRYHEVRGRFDDDARRLYEGFLSQAGAPPGNAPPRHI